MGIKNDVRNCSSTPEACDTTGSSVLDARNYVTWNGSDLCCQLIDATNNNSVVRETCEKLLVLPPVEMEVEPVADIFMPYSLRCLGRYVSGDAQVTENVCVCLFVCVCVCVRACVRVCV